MKYKFKPVAFAVVTALGCAHIPARATVITTAGASFFGTPAPSTTNTTSNPDTSVSTAGGITASAYDASADFRVIGRSAYFGTETGNGTAAWTGSFTNSTNQLLAVYLDFHIFPGVVGYFGYGTTGGSSGGVDFRISSNRAGTVFQSGLQLNRSGNVFSASTSGTDIYNEESACLGACFGGTTVRYNGHSQSVLVGNLAAGESVTVDYLVSGFYSHSSTMVLENFNDYGQIFVGAGDPAYWTATEQNGTYSLPKFSAQNADPNPAPLPGTAILAILGLAALARKRTSAAPN